MDYNKKIKVKDENKKTINHYSGCNYITNVRVNFLLATDKKNRGTINSFMLRDIEITYINSGINAQ